jgi:DNA polymerase V
MPSPDDHDGMVPVGRGRPAVKDAPRASVSIGFGSPSQDSGVTALDLNDVLVRHPQASFLMRASGQAMHDAGIDDGDLLLLDRAITPSHGHVVVASVGGEFLCRRLVKHAGGALLRASAPGCPDTLPDEADELRVWGVVTHVIKAMPV